MTAKIGLLSDVHASPEPVSEALTLFDHAGVETILCAGDIAGYGRKLAQTVALLKSSECRSVLGNHDLWWLEERDPEEGGVAGEYLRALPRVMEFSAENIKIHLVHASPPESLMQGMRLLGEDAELLPEEKARWTERLRLCTADVLVVGHTHQVFAERLGHVLVINPGSTLFNHTCAILTLPGMTVEIFPLSGKKPIMSWNWGLFYASQLSLRQIDLLTESFVPTLCQFADWAILHSDAT